MLAALRVFPAKRSLFGLAIVPLLVFLTHADGTDLLEAAKREGTVVVYGALAAIRPNP